MFFHCSLVPCRGGKRHGGKHVVRPTDLSAVVDVHDAIECCQGDKSIFTPIERAGSTLPAFRIRDRPGLVYFPNALSANEQVRLLTAPVTCVATKWGRLGQTGVIERSESVPLELQTLQ